MGLISWDNSKGFWANVGGGIADNTVEKIPNWDDSKGFTQNVTGGASDLLGAAAKTVSGVGSSFLGGLKKYAIPAAIIGAGVLLLPQLLRKK